MTIGPQDLDLAVGQTSVASITGVMSNGSIAQQAELNAVQWTSDNDSVVTVDHASITGVGAGSASVTAQSGALSATMSVEVVASQSGVAAVVGLEHGEGTGDDCYAAAVVDRSHHRQHAA